MAKFNDGFGVGFNDNDGGAGFFVTSHGVEEYKRHARIMGRWRAKLFFVRKLWLALNNAERWAEVQGTSRWKRLRGWKA